MKQKNYSLSTEAVRDHLRDKINVKGLGHQKNIENILDLLLTLPEDSINAILMLSIIKKEYSSVKIGDIVKYLPCNYSLQYDEDIMLDKNLMDDEGYVFGTILKDSSWNGVEDFDPYYNKMKVNTYIWENNEIIISENIVPTFDLIIIKELPEFNSSKLTDFLVIDDEDIPQEKIKTIKQN